MTPELLPCPFCGSAALLSNHARFNYDTRQTVWHVECTNSDECEAALTGFARLCRVSLSQAIAVLSSWEQGA